MSRKRSVRKSRKWLYGTIITAFLLLVVTGILFLSRQANPKPVILYVNQGNGIVNSSNLGSMLNFAKVRGFNTIFFQIYRSGQLLFAMDQLQFFVTSSHSQGIRFFFALYLTNSSQQLPNSVYSEGEDGISLDMSSLSAAVQTEYLASLRMNYHSGLIAVTTANFTTTLNPDLLVLETYGVQGQVFVRHGIIASVGVFATADRTDYDQQFQYALGNSDGVMVFDYAGLLKHGY